MSDRVSGRPSRLQPAARAALLLGLLGIVAGPLASLATAAGGLTVTTPFPAVVAEPGSTASFALTVDVPSAMRVDLKTTGVPTGWTARFRGGGLTVDGVYVDPKASPSLTLDVEIPDSATASSNTIVVTATGGGLSDALPLSIRIADAAAGNVTLTTDSPGQRGPASTTFSYTITIHNDTATEIAFTMDAVGPPGWTVAAKPSSAAQATSVTVTPSGTGTMSVTATPPSDVTAGDYPLQASVTGGGKTASIDLAVSITGTYALVLTTPDQVLSTTANAGSVKDLQLTVTNNGSAPVANVAMSASAPTNWKVEFTPPTVPSIEAGATQTVTAHITPSGDAIAGDYEMTITSRATEASDDVSIRVRVETPQFWWIVGVVLIVAVFAGLYWVFRTYGRR
ncbi:MAG TPA: NEW3 domain-containing protein [Candidatus Limnocylindrales bacterium]